MAPISSRLASRRIASCTVLAWVGLAANGWSATDVPGGSINQTWTAAGSPYNLQGDIIVPTGAYLHIEQGVTVAVSGTDDQASGLDTGRVEITIRGDLDVHGTAAGALELEPPAEESSEAAAVAPAAAPAAAPKHARQDSRSLALVLVAARARRCARPLAPATAHAAAPRMRATARVDTPVRGR